MRRLNGTDFLYNTPNTSEFFKNLPRYLAVGFWYWDSKSNHIHFSKKILSVIGIKSDDQGVDLEDFFRAVHPDDQKKLRKSFKRLLSGKPISGDLEFRVQRKVYWRWVRTNAVVAEHDENGAVSIIIGKFYDIDTAKYSSLQVESNQKFLFSFFNYNQPSNIFAWFNPRQNRLGVKLTNKSFLLFEELKPFVTANELSQLEQGWGQFIKSGDSDFNTTFNFIGADKLPKKYKIFASRFSDNQIEGVIFDLASVSEAEGTGVKSSKYSALLNMHQLFIFAFDSSGNIVFSNKYAERVLGYKTSELNADQNFKKVFLPYPDTHKRFIEFIKGKSSKSFDCIIACKDNTERNVSWNLIHDLDISNEIYVIGRDTTYLKQIEQNRDRLQVRNSQNSRLLERLLLRTNAENFFFVLGEELEQIYPKKVSAVFSYDPSDGFITIEGVFGITHRLWEAFIAELGWNPAGRRFLLQPDLIEIISKEGASKIEQSFFDLTDGFISVSAAKIIEKTFGIEKIFYSSLLVNNILYGGIVVFENSSISNFDIESLRDLAKIASQAYHKLNVEKEYISKLEVLKLNNQRKLDLLTNVSHEIRTPLNAILGFSQLLANSELTEETKNQYINIINSKGMTLTRLINDIIDFNKIEKGEITIVRSEISVNNLLNDVFNFYLNDLTLFKREGIDLKLTIPEGTSFLELFTDEGRLIQVLENIIDNALKFTERGVVELGYSINNDKINIFVRDTGVGIDPKVQEIIFEKYRQFDNAKTGIGAGLGLKISKEITSMLGGTITIDSEVGVGTTVTLQFPLVSVASDVKKDQDEVSEEDRRVDFKNKVVLIVDDEEVNYLILNELLSAWGATTLWAKNGKEAVELVTTITQTIDAVLMDIRMPVMDGYAATMEIKQINPAIPIIAQTAYASDEDRLKAEAAGCNGYITKPIDTSVLSEVLEIFLTS